MLLSFGNRLIPYSVASFAFRGIVCALISSIFSSMICLQVDFRQPFYFESNVVNALSSLSSNYCLSVTAEGANQNA